MLAVAACMPVCIDHGLRQIQRCCPHTVVFPCVLPVYTKNGGEVCSRNRMFSVKVLVD